MAKYLLQPGHNHDEIYEKIGAGGVSDHGALSGLADDDHSQYLNNTRHDTTTRHALGTVVPHDDHGALSGLADDDHSQYLNNTRHDATARHTLGTVVPHDDHGALSGLSDNDHPQYRLAADVIDHGALSGLADNDHPQYLLTTAKAADSDKLDGLDSTDFVKNSALGVWQDWTPTVTGWAAGYTVNTARYKLIGKTCFFTVDISGTSNSTAVNIVMPFTSYSGAGAPVWGGTNAYVQNNGTAATTSASRWYIGENSATLIAHTNMSTGTWTASGVKRIRVMGFYEIA